MSVGENESICGWRDSSSSFTMALFSLSSISLCGLLYAHDWIGIGLNFYPN